MDQNIIDQLEDLTFLKREDNGRYHNTGHVVVTAQGLRKVQIPNPRQDDVRYPACFSRIRMDGVYEVVKGKVENDYTTIDGKKIFFYFFVPTVERGAVPTQPR